ncbi:hypothetical protein, partial [Pseudomonas syringae group genomosp. 3]|uniref:hypothetical protein n=1 Tax=Pseudomonas syringae group genomosp. 3 TaxID=251701 RepID=UPI001F2221A1
AAQGTVTGIGLGEGLLNCAKKSETYFLFDERCRQNHVVSRRKYSSLGQPSPRLAYRKLP